jgi:hypothetical protein
LTFCRPSACTQKATAELDLGLKVEMMRRKVGLGGCCPHCDELALVGELLGLLSLPDDIYPVRRRLRIR